MVASSQSSSSLADDEGAAARNVSQAYVFELPRLGKIRPVPSKRIESSPMSVGFEGLGHRRFDPTKTYRHLAALGVKWARCLTGWNRCEQTPGEFTFGWLDKIVDSLLEIGVQPWFNLGDSNKLYTRAQLDTSVGWWPPIFDVEAQKAWVRFVGKLADHFSDRVTHWEIWNEPNYPIFWKPNKPDAADYVELVKITVPEIRNRVRSSVIIGGATAHIPFDYIGECLKAGLGDLIDRFSYHPYRAIPEAHYDQDIRRLRKMIAKRNNKVRLWQGENGCPSRGGKDTSGAFHMLDWNETRQAKWVLRRILSDLRLDLELTSYFHMVDTISGRGRTNRKGLLRNDYSPKPSYHAFQCLCTLYDSTTKRIDITPELVGQRHEQLQDGVFIRNGRVIYAWWLPADLFKPFIPRKVDVHMPLPPGASLQDPVLIDPLNQTVFSLPHAIVANGNLRLKGLPVLDYPLMVTDRTIANV